MSEPLEVLRLRADVVAVTAERNALRAELERRGRTCDRRTIDHGCILPAEHLPVGSVLWHHDGRSVWCEPDDSLE